VVSPHPDDEIFGAGGLIRTWCRLGYPVTVVSVTDGEAAYPDWLGLNHIRRRELVEALRLLCDVPVGAVRLGLPDGRVREHAGTLFAALSRLLSNEPTLIAPYEWDGHPDHDVTGAVCCELARLHGLPIARYPIWTWHHGDPDVLAGERIGRFMLSPAARRAKAAAMQAFASQLRPPARQPIVPGHVLPYFMRGFEAFLHD
jgi:LmbE family N-acetylglucosaminyl deacetylase